MIVLGLVAKEAHVPPSFTSLDEHVLQQFMSLDHQAKIVFRRALRDSYTLDLDNMPPNPASPSQIHENHALTFNQQYQQGISYTRPIATEILRRRGVDVQNFNAKYNPETYRIFFHRQPDFLVASRSVMLLTLSEWFHLAGQRVEAQMPEAISGYK